MLTSKQKSQLKKLANPLSATYSVGKEGVSENLLEGILNYLKVHELMKIQKLKNCELSDEEIRTYLERKGISYVNKIGNIIIVYKQGKEPKIKLCK